MASLELKRQFIKEQFIIAHKIVEIQEKFRKIFFDEEKFTLKEGFPFNLWMLETCLIIPMFKADIFEIENTFNDIDLDSVKFIELRRMTGAGDPFRNFTQIYINYFQDMKNLKDKFERYINEMNIEYVNLTADGASESEKLKVMEKIKMINNAKKKLCGFLIC